MLNIKSEYKNNIKKKKVLFCFVLLFSLILHSVANSKFNFIFSFEPSLQKLFIIFRV